MEQGKDGGQGAQVGDDDVEQGQGGNGEDVMLIVDSPSDEDSLLVMIKGQWSILNLVFEMTFQGFNRKSEDEAILVSFKEGERSDKEKLSSVELPHWKTK